MSTLAPEKVRSKEMPVAVSAWKMNRVKRYLVEREKHEPGLIDRLEVEYKKFITIRLTHPEVAIAPSSLVDELWHTHILFTKDYLAFCAEVNAGSYIHHNPFLAGDKPLGSPSVRKTLALYRPMFGQPDCELWPEAADCSASCGDCSSSACGPRCT